MLSCSLSLVIAIWNVVQASTTLKKVNHKKITYVAYMVVALSSIFSMIIAILSSFGPASIGVGDVFVNSIPFVTGIPEVLLLLYMKFMTTSETTGIEWIDDLLISRVLAMLPETAVIFTDGPLVTFCKTGNMAVLYKYSDGQLSCLYEGAGWVLRLLSTIYTFKMVWAILKLTPSNFSRSSKASVTQTGSKGSKSPSSQVSSNAPVTQTIAIKQVGSTAEDKY